MKNEVDFHGLTAGDALERVHQLVSDVRLNKPSGEEWRIITGNGVIKQQVIDLFGSYQIEAREELGNSGSLRVFIE